ncbi:unnamed protein product [Protopolystoma xenopodis]|uniref:FERM domain-containing protein n=1 Tax=Protopolystoma xenopodis TaxID=117903 RepID=A0A3S5ARK9_9PLAT|nr:unnamed protein product [Protopolystoma xenopodis]
MINYCALTFPYTAMSSVTLIVRIEHAGTQYYFRTSSDYTIFDLCREIRNNFEEACIGNRMFSLVLIFLANEYGIFTYDPDPKHSAWLESSKTLSYYHISDQAEVSYKYKMRRLVIKTMDGTKKTLQVDDSKSIAELMFTICAKMGITNYEEYSLIRELDEEEKMKTLTIRKAKSIAKDVDKLEKMKLKLHTDDDLNWLSHSKTLRQYGIDEMEILLLRRKYFFSDQNVDARDPVQLNLLYIQVRIY